MRHLLMTLFLLMAISVIAQERKPAEEGWYNLTQMSFIIGEMNEYSPAKSNLIPSVTNINGYRFGEHFSLGVGVGMTSFSYPVFPVFADFRFTFFKGNLSPVLAFKGGYSIAHNKKEIYPGEYSGDYKNKGGGLFCPELGFKLVMNERADFLLTIGYYYQHIESEIKNSPGSYYMRHDRVTDINRLSFTIGFLFK